MRKHNQLKVRIVMMWGGEIGEERPFASTERQKLEYVSFCISLFKFLVISGR